MSGGRAPLRRVLMIAFHFPPMRGSSGIQRTLSFVKHLPRFGWEPLVLTASASVYESTSDDLLRDVPAGTVVERAFAMDTARHLAIGGRYPRGLAVPDRWRTWRLPASWLGSRMIRRYRPDAIWSTYPIATAHAIGSKLAASSGLPWIADFRDPMAQVGYPEDPATWKAFDRIERDVVRRAATSVFTTPGCAALYRNRYPAIAQDRFVVIENGYDEDAFTGTRNDVTAAEPRERFVLLHSGIVYSSERDPSKLFAALGTLKRAGTLTAANFQLRLRATANDDALRAMATSNDVEDLIAIEPPIAYRAALDEMLAVDGLLVLQAANCNEQIPAKIYEYIRARRPVLALTDAAGDTAVTLRAAGLASIAPLDDAAAIGQALPAFIARVRAGSEPLARSDMIEASSRGNRTAELAAVLDASVASGAARRA